MPDPEIEENSDTEQEWSPLLRRELIQTAVAVGTYLVIKLALDLYDEDSKLRWRLKRAWHEVMVTLSSDEENRQIATAAARGIDYAQIWLTRQWESRKS